MLFSFFLICMVIPLGAYDLFKRIQKRFGIFMLQRGHEQYSKYDALSIGDRLDKYNTTIVSMVDDLHRLIESRTDELDYMVKRSDKLEQENKRLVDDCLELERHKRTLTREIRRLVYKYPFGIPIGTMILGFFLSIMLGPYSDSIRELILGLL